MRSRQRGGALVELAFVLPVLVLLALATVEFAQALAAYKTLVTQVRSAARYLSTRPPGAGYVEARCLVTHGLASSALPCPGTALMAGLAAPGLIVTVLDARNAPGTHQAQRTAASLAVAHGTTLNLVTVSVSGYRHPTILSTWLAGVATLDFGSISLTMQQAS
ncbi:MAG: TadE/TadG family type IV pilus assembly protein [Ramlibacter sp.]